jgi:hypothetical protein
MWRFREPTQPSGPRSVIDRAESLIHLSDTCLFSALRAKGLCLERRSETRSSSIRTDEKAFRAESQ